MAAALCGNDHSKVLMEKCRKGHLPGTGPRSDGLWMVRVEAPEDGFEKPWEPFTDGSKAAELRSSIRVVQ